MDLYPPELRGAIDELNAWIYEKINNGVYRVFKGNCEGGCLVCAGSAWALLPDFPSQPKHETHHTPNRPTNQCGFATSQRAYEAAVGDVFAGLDQVEAILSKQRFLAGDALTEADARLFPTVVRFDAVYNSLFRCTRRRVADYPSLTQWLREVYQLPGVAATADVPGFVRSYYGNLFPLNPSGIVPAGPDENDLRLMDPHDREARFPIPPGPGRAGPGNVFRVK